MAASIREKTDENHNVSKRLVAVTLVLDDYHIITDAWVHDMVRFLLEHLPHLLHLVIISHQDPPLPLVSVPATMSERYEQS